MKSANEESRENASQTYVPTNEELKCAEVIENRFPDGDHLIAVAARLVKIMTGRPQSDIDGFIHMVLRDHNKLEMAALTQVLNDKLPGDERKDWWKRWLAARLAHIDKYLKAY